MLGTAITSIAMMLPMQVDMNSIQVDGNNKAKAMTLLKAGGIPATAGEPQQYTIPKVTITGLDEPYPLGELVILEAKYDKAQLAAGSPGLTFNWTVLDNGKPKNLFVSDNGARIAFGGGVKNREITIVLDVNCQFETKQVFKVLGADGKTTDREFIVDSKSLSPSPILSKVVIGDGSPLPNPDNPFNPTPNPGPGPGPIIPPAPVVPDSPLGLTKFAYDLFTADANLDSKSKVALAGKLADGLEGIAAKINGVKTYRDVAVILADTKASNKTAFASLPIDLTKSVALRDGINAKMTELWNARKINTAEDIAAAWFELSAGLRLVK